MPQILAPSPDLVSSIDFGAVRVEDPLSWGRAPFTASVAEDEPAAPARR